LGRTLSFEVRTDIPLPEQEALSAFLENAERCAVHVKMVGSVSRQIKKNDEQRSDEAPVRDDEDSFCGVKLAEMLSKKSFGPGNKVPKGFASWGVHVWIPLPLSVPLRIETPHRFLLMSRELSKIHFLEFGDVEKIPGMGCETVPEDFGSGTGSLQGAGIPSMDFHPCKPPGEVSDLLSLKDTLDFLKAV